MSLLPEESSAGCAVKHDSAEIHVDMNGATESGGMDVLEGAGDGQSRLLGYLHEAREHGDLANGSMFDGLRKIQKGKSIADTELSSITALHPDHSPAGSVSSPDDAPSIHGSVASSLGSSAFGSPFPWSPSPSLQPFDRRFQSRLRPGSPSQLTRSPSPSLVNQALRRSSILSDLDALNGLPVISSPREPIRWTTLKKIKGQLYSEAGRRKFGSPTCIVGSTKIIVGTSKGMILVFDYYQSLNSIIGLGTKAIECGSITALAVSADHTTVAGGHSQGHIFTWELNKPARPFLNIAPIPLPSLESRKVDGHVEGVSVLHIGFLGTRHTALFSADGRGMAFSHLATRGMGALGRIVKTARIRGRYPFDSSAGGRQRKPSAVLACAALPIGNVYQATDSMGLVAMLTPQRLGIFSTTPITETQHQSPRPREIPHDVPLSGSLAWFPALRLKEDPVSNPAGVLVSKSKLAYSWSNSLTVMEVSVLDSDDPEDVTGPPELQFRARSEWKCDEAIVAVQWISRQVLGVLTVTQRLMILEDVSMCLTETFDLMPKQILHHNVFSHQLKPLITESENEDIAPTSIADSFYQSLKTFKGRLFLLGQNEIFYGALSNWTDRLLAVMEVDDFVGVIELATAYYVGDANLITVGLPERDHLRHPLVQEQLLEMMSASLRYAFGAAAQGIEAPAKKQLEKLCTACFKACVSMNAIDYLFDIVYEHYEAGSSEGIFLENLEPYVLDRTIRFVPPMIVKGLIKHFTFLEQNGRLEEILCQMDTRTFDIDQITSLCKQHNLYDALIYVWNSALGDYITPMIELLSLLIPRHYSQAALNGDSMYAVNTLKIFPYLSYTWTGRVYPTGEFLPDADASFAKASLYYFFFLGRTITWPRQGGSPFLTRPHSAFEPSFPYLRLILEFDAPSFLSALNEAFEDPFLNGPLDQTPPDSKSDPTEEQMFARSVNRQYIVTILMEVLNKNDFTNHNTIYLDMFIARNLPKFPQFMLFTGSALNQILIGLCNYPGPDIADDCELSVEYLLSVYRPPHLEEMITLFTNAKFYRVLESIFRAEKQYGKLLQVHFDDEQHLEAVFTCVEECLRPQSNLSEKQREEVRRVISERASEFVGINNEASATVINTYAPDLHEKLLDAIHGSPQQQFQYLQAIFEPPQTEKDNNKRSEIMRNGPLVELYVKLMCAYDPSHVPGFVGNLQSGDLRLEEVLPALENSGVVDATVMLMAREGQIREAMDRLVNHLNSIGKSISGILQSYRDKPGEPEDPGLRQGLDSLLASLSRYSKVGIWLCQGQMGAIKKGKNEPSHYKRTSVERTSLTKEELLWLDFVDTIVRIAKDCMSLLNCSRSADILKMVNSQTTAEQASPAQPTTQSMASANAPPIKCRVTDYLRTMVQETFTSLLKSTSSPANSGTMSFLRILREFLKRASVSSPSLSELRSVLAGIFDAHIYEKQLLELANKLLDQDRFEDVKEVAGLRQRGWRAGSQACEVCGKRAWGPGAAGGIFSAWEMKKVDEFRRKKNNEMEQGKVAEMGKGKGIAHAATTATNTSSATTTVASTPSAWKGRAIGREMIDSLDHQEVSETSTPPNFASPLVLFTCRHVFHKSCLEKVLQPTSGNGLGTEGVVFKCLECDKTE